MRYERKTWILNNHNEKKTFEKDNMARAAEMYRLYENMIEGNCCRPVP